MTAWILKAAALRIRMNCLWLSEFCIISDAVSWSQLISKTCLNHLTQRSGLLHSHHDLCSWTIHCDFENFALSVMLFRGSSSSTRPSITTSLYLSFPSTSLLHIPSFLLHFSISYFISDSLGSMRRQLPHAQSISRQGSLPIRITTPWGFLCSWFIYPYTRHICCYALCIPLEMFYDRFVTCAFPKCDNHV